MSAQTSVSDTLVNLQANRSLKPYDSGTLLANGNQVFVLGTNSWAKDEFEKEYLTSDTPYLKQYRVNESAEDLLALSTTWFRLRKAGGPSVIESLTDEQLFRSVTEADRVMANTIRDYYRKKIVVLTLREVKLTKFREDMSKFIHANGKMFTNDMLPLAYRLPEYYEYDTAFSDMMRDLTPRSLDRTQALTEAHTLRPLRKFNVKRKYHYNHEYWFKDEHDRAVLIMLEHINSCKSLFEREFKKESMDMQLTGYATSRDGFTYFKVNKWEVE